MALLLPLALLLLQGTLTTAAFATISRLQSSSGSLQGGTYLVIWGSGFDRGGMSGSTQVYLGTSPCTVVPYYSSDLKLVCYTPPSPVAAQVQVSVQLVYEGVSGSSYATCTPGPCTFTYSAAATPTIAYSSLGGSPGSTLRFYGTLYGPSTQWYNIRIGPRDTGLVCDVSPDVQAPGIPKLPSPNTGQNSFPSEDSLRDIGGRSVVKCIAPPSEAGRYNVTLETRDPALGSTGYGEAARARAAKLALPPLPSSAAAAAAAAAGDVYHLTMLATVTALSTGSSGLLGGGSLTISGAGFSTAPGGNSVMLVGGDGAGGEALIPCNITASSSTQITCTPGAAPASTSTTSPAALARGLSGGAGLSYTYFPLSGAAADIAQNWATAPGMPAPTYSFLGTDAAQGAFRSEGTYFYAQQVQGYFVPPITANYTFYDYSDDASALYISSDAQAANLTRIVMQSRILTNLYIGGTTPFPTAPPLYLQAGKRYLFQLQHQQGWGEDYVAVAVRISTGAAANPLSSPLQAVFQSTPAVISIAVGTATVRQVQTLTLGGAASGGTWSIGVVGAPPTATVTTLAVGASQGEVRAALEAARACGCSSFTVVRAAWTGSGSATGFTYNVSINCPPPVASGLHPTIFIQPISLSPAPGLATVVTTTATAVTPSTPLSGTFSCAWASSSAAATPAIAFNTAAWQLAGALQALPGFPALYGTDSSVVQLFAGSAARDGYEYMLTLNGVGSSVPSLACSGTDPATGASTLSGSGATVTVSVLQEGSTDPFLAPIPVAGFFETASSTPTVRVTSNGLLAACSATGNASSPSPCSFRYDDALTPLITGITLSGPVQAGTQVSITGTGFAPLPGAAAALRGNASLGLNALYTVALLPPGLAQLPAAQSLCNVTGASASAINCTLPNAPAGQLALSLTVAGGRGRARLSPSLPPSAASLLFSLLCTSLSPASGSMAGGTLLTLTGSGFPLLSATANVSVGGLPCAIASATSMSTAGLTCTTAALNASSGTGAQPAPAATPMPVTVNGVACPGTFTYSTEVTPVLVGVSPAALPAGASGRVTLALTVPLPAGGGAALPNGTSVSVGGRPCALLSNVTTGTTASSASVSVTCMLVRGKPLPPALAASATPAVLIPPFGAATTNSATVLDTSYYVTGAPLAVASGSCMGGTSVTIPGVGLRASAGATAVWFYPLAVAGLEEGSNLTAPDRLPCAVTGVAGDGSWVQCTTSAPSAAHMLSSSSTMVIPGSFLVQQNGITAPSAGASARTPAFTYARATTPVITGFSVNASSPGAPTFTVTGSGLSGGALTLALALAPAYQVAGAIAAAAAFPGNFTAASIEPGGASATGALPPIAAGQYLLQAATLQGYAMVNASEPTASPALVAYPPGTPGNPLPVVLLTNPLAFTGVQGFSPGQGPVGSLAGQHSLTLTGWGFVPGGTAVTFSPTGTSSAIRATITAITPTAITILTPALSYTTYPNLATAAPPVYTIAVTLTDSPFTSTSIPAIYTYSGAATPTLTSVSPSTGLTSGTVLTLTGTGFSASPEAGVAVTIGGALCAISTPSWTATSFTCTLGATPAGQHRVIVTWPSRGAARGPSPSTPSVAVPLAAAVTGSVTGAGGCTVVAGGYGGGTLLTLTGSGFAVPGTGGSNTVTVCGKACSLSSELPAPTYTSLTCRTPPISTPAAMTAFNAQPRAVLTGTPFGATSLTSPLLPAAAIATAFDGDVASPYLSLCRVGLEFTGSATASAFVTRVRWYAAFQQAAAFRGGVWQGSVGSPTTAGSSGVAWAPLAAVGEVQEGWNTLDIFNNPGQNSTSAFSSLTPLRAVQFLFNPATSTGTRCTGMELQVLGYAVDSSIESCALNVTVAGPRDVFQGVQSVVSAAPTGACATPSGSSSSMALSAALTPVITGVSPNNGTALGGTVVTLSGANFGLGGSPTAVGAVASLNGVPCAITAVTATAVQCTTGARDSIRPLDISLYLPGGGYALYNSTSTFFQYLDKWSDLTTWVNQEPPIAGDTVVVPAGQAILVDVSPPPLFLVYIAGAMVFDNRDLTFDANYILIQGGRLQAGTESAPFLNKLTITLHGTRYGSIEIPDVGAKALAVMNRPAASSSSSGMGGMGGMGGMAPMAADAMDPTLIIGTLDLHGAPRVAVWTKVAATAPAGSRLIRTASPVDFAPGDTIVITSSSWDYLEAERCTVAALLDPHTIQVEAPLAYTHQSTIMPAGQWGHSDVDLRCEVGLLSRNIVVQGDEGSAEEAFGAHIIAVHGGILRLENIEVRRSGQSFNLGRYSTHMHMLGDSGASSYVRYNSIHDTYQRMTTVHATNYATVEGNFGFQILGHSLFLEDGVEKYNVIQGNLIASTERCYACLKGDTKPASFWTASPTNFWRNNVAAGSTNDGLWLELPGNPHGPSFSPLICPVGNPVGEWRNNHAHSNGVHGLRLYPVVTPFVNPCDSTSGAAPQYFYNFTSWRNGNHGIFGKNNGALRHVNAKLVENREDDFFQLRYIGNLPGALGLYTPTDANIANCLFIGVADPVATPIWNKRAVFIPGFEFFLLAGATFVNYGAVGALASCADCDQDDNLRNGGYTTRMRGLRFVNTSVRVLWTSPFRDIFSDLDGSLTGTAPGAWAMPYYAFNNWPECSRDVGGALGGGHVCTSAVTVRRMQMDNAKPVAQLQFKNINVSSPVGSDVILFRPKEIYGWAWPAVTNAAPAPSASGPKDYSIGFQSAPWLVDWLGLNLRYSEPDYVVPGEWTRLSFSWIASRYRNRVWFQQRVNAPGAEVPALPVGADGSQTLPGPLSLFGTGTFFSGANVSDVWTVGLSTGNINGTNPLTNALAYSLAAENLQCPDKGCYVPPLGALGNATRWSDPATWPFRRLPVAGDTVTINATQWVLLDISPPPLLRVNVLGRLSFLPGAGDITLTAGAVVVWREMNMGTAEAPFTGGVASLVLTGTVYSPSVVVDNNIVAGNKVLLVLGSFTAVGEAVAVPWTRLAATAAAGSSTLQLATSVAGSWSVGSSLTLPPTEWDLPLQEETAVIAGISPDGLTVTLERPLAFAHYSGPAAPASATSPRATAARIACPVGLLTRNVRIIGNVSSTPILIQNPYSSAPPALGPDSYGGHIHVASIARPDMAQAQWRIGVVDLRYAELRGLGKQGTQFGGVNVMYGYSLVSADATPSATNPLGAQPVPTNNIQGCAFSSAFNMGLQAVGTRNIVFASNVLQRPMRWGLNLDAASTNASITGNLISALRLDPSINAPGTTLWTNPASAFLIDAPTVAALQGNAVAGSADAAYTLHPEVTCGTSAAAAAAAGFPPAATLAPTTGANEALSVLIGVFILPTRARSPPGGPTFPWCGTRLAGFTVAKAAHIGILAVDGLSDIAVLGGGVYESHIGLSLNYVTSSDAQARSDVRDMLFIGSGAASAAAAAAATGGACPPSRLCRASVTGDEAAASSTLCPSVLGPAYARVGILGAQYTNRGKTCTVDGSLPACLPPNMPHRMCGQPWEKRFGLPSTHATQLYLTGTTFAGFVGSEAPCGGSSVGASSYAYAHNPTQIDAAVPVYAAGVVWDGVGEEGRFSFRTTSATQTTTMGGVNVGGGDGFQGILLFDSDGSLTGLGANTSVLGPNPALAMNAPACVWKQAWLGSVCPGVVYRQAIMENMGE